ncbi:MAG: MBL fold metallo-hydrolase [Gammaproteobacteria bacterium]|nr:MBL fold metallo-hydrolase [Gammaproteobacteria bacterium]
MTPGNSAQITTLDDGIFAVDTEYLRPLQDASHLIVEDGRGAFVDTGNNDSVPLLLDALHQQDLDAADVDFVFLTHIHLDHAGGAGLLMQRLPNARCVIHPRGAPHMISPEKLIKGTEAVYGVARTRELYGEIRPIDEQRVVVAEDGQWVDFCGREMQTLFTEGHARHHYCLNDPASRGVFTGDNFGISYRELDTARGEFIYPTSTPASFDPREAHKSVDRIMACNPEQVYLTHYSRVRDLDRLAGDMHAGIDAYEQMALDCRSADDRDDALRAAMYEYLSTRIIEHGFKGDRDALRSIVQVDVTLNAAGLMAWLDRLEKRR